MSSENPDRRRLSVNIRTPLEAATLARFGWLIGMRWLFVLAIFAGAFVGGATLNGFPAARIASAGMVVAGVNLLLQLIYLRLTRYDPRQRQPVITLLIQLQVMTDWLALLALIHWTGGIDSPLLHFFIFHLALTAIFLSPGFTALALIFIVVATSLLFWLEFLGVFSPVRIPGFSSPESRHTAFSILNFSFWYFSTLGVMALLIGAVMRGLRRRERAALRVRRRLEEANRLISQISEERVRLMHAMGHELRSPLAAASSMLSAMDLSRGADLPADVREIHGRIQKRLKGLVDLIGELLELAENRRSSHPPQVRRLNLCALLEDLVGEYRAPAEEAGLRIERRCLEAEDVWLSDNEERLRRVFANLLSNAIKYSRRGGCVRLETRVVERSVIVEIHDEGIGIAADQVPRLFSEFYRTPQSRRHTREGTGLGLAITRDLIQAAGGRIEVESELGQGSLFRVILPRSA
jgi:signal transduction histidine kinase